MEEERECMSGGELCVRVERERVYKWRGVVCERRREYESSRVCERRRESV